MIAPQIAWAINLSRELASGTCRPGQAGLRGVVRAYAGHALVTETIAISQSEVSQESLGERLIGRADRLAMVDQDQIADRKAHASRLIDQAVSDIRREVGLAGQDPEIVLRWASNQSPAVILLVECSDMVAASERPEEGYGEASCVRRALEHGATIGFLPAAAFAVKALVQNAYGAVVAQRVRCGHVRQSALEAVVEAHDLEPLALVALNVEGTNGLDAVWNSGAATDKYRQQHKQKWLLQQSIQCLVSLKRQSQGI